MGSSSVLRGPRRAALVAITALVAGATAASFSESYRGLYLWALHHGLSGPWAAIWPLQVDVFIAVGELALFVALADRWAPRSRLAAWAVTLAGLAVSVAGNVGHVAGHDLASRATAAVPPLAAAGALAVGLGVLKRVVGAHAQAKPESPVVPAPASTAKPLKPAPERAPKTAKKPAPDARPEVHFGDVLAAGELPSVRRIRRELRVGQPKAQEVQAALAASMNGHTPE